MTPLQEIAQRLQDALNVSVPCGSITLNFNEATVQSVETRIHQRVAVDKRAPKVQT